MPCQKEALMLVRAVQVTPSGLVITSVEEVPSLATAANTDPFHAMRRHASELDAVCSVQVMPSVLVAQRFVPSTEVALHVVPFQARSFHVLSCEPGDVRIVQTMPSKLV